jgi:hypothetical protein
MATKRIEIKLKSGDAYSIPIDAGDVISLRKMVDVEYDYAAEEGKQRIETSTHVVEVSHHELVCSDEAEAEEVYKTLVAAAASAGESRNERRDDELAAGLLETLAAVKKHLELSNEVLGAFSPVVKELAPTIKEMSPLVVDLVRLSKPALELTAVELQKEVDQAKAAEAKAG